MDLTAQLRDPALITLAQQLRELVGDDDVAFVDMLDGESNVVETVRAALRMEAACEANEAACKALAQRYGARAHDFAGRRERLRNAIVQFMGETGEKSMTLPEGTITRKAGAPKVVGDADPNTLPPEFVRIKTDISLDRTAIKRALEQGADVPGFSLSNGCETLQIRK